MRIRARQLAICITPEHKLSKIKDRRSARGLFMNLSSSRASQSRAHLNQKPPGESAEAHQIFNTQEERQVAARASAHEDAPANESSGELPLQMTSRSAHSPTTEAQATPTAATQPTSAASASSMRSPRAHLSRLLGLLALLTATCSGQEAQPGRPGAPRISVGSAPADSVSLARSSSASSAVQNVTAQNGQSVLLHCVVDPPSELGVSWFRGAVEPQLLTFDSNTVIEDERFVVRQGLMAHDDWALQIKNLDKSSDAGLYQCQSHSEPPRSQFYQLNIVEPQAQIAGAPDLAVKLGAAINLTCLITQLSDELPFIFWYHNQQVINKRLSDSGRGKIVISRLETGGERAGGGGHSHSLTATLHIFHSLLADSGNYTCLPPGSGRPASIHVHVLEGSNKRLIMFQNDGQQYVPAPPSPIHLVAPAASSQASNSALSVHVWRLSQGRAYALFVGLVIASAWYQLVAQTQMLFSFLLLAIIGFFLGLVTDRAVPRRTARRGQVPRAEAGTGGQSPAPNAPDGGPLHLLAHKNAGSSGSENSLLATATTDLSATSSGSGRRRAPTERAPSRPPMTSPSSQSTASSSAGSASTGYNSDAGSSAPVGHRQRHRKPPQECRLTPDQHQLSAEAAAGIAAVDCATSTPNQSPDAGDMIELVAQPTALRLIMDEFSGGAGAAASRSPCWSPISASYSLGAGSLRWAPAAISADATSPATTAPASGRGGRHQFSSAEPVGGRANWRASGRPSVAPDARHLEPHYSTPSLSAAPPGSPQVSPGGGGGGGGG